VHQWKLDDRTVSVSMLERFTNLMNAVPEVQDWMTHHQVDVQGWKSDLHCSAYYDSIGNDAGYAEEISAHLQTRYNMHLESLWLGQQGIGMEACLTVKQQELWNQPEMTIPHVTISVSQECHAKYIRRMITNLKESCEGKLVGNFQGALLYAIGENGFCWEL